MNVLTFRHLLDRLFLMHPSYHVHLLCIFFPWNQYLYHQPNYRVLQTCSLDCFLVTYGNDNETHLTSNKCLPIQFKAMGGQLRARTTIDVEQNRIFLEGLKGRRQYLFGRHLYIKQFNTKSKKKPTWKYSFLPMPSSVVMVVIRYVGSK